MTDAAKLELLMQMYDWNEHTDLLLTYLSIAGEIIINRAFPYANGCITEVPNKYANKQISIACYLLNKRGAEGEITHKENGIDRYYESADVPESMLSDIVPFCGVMK